MNANSRRERLGALAADVLSLARGQRREELIEARIAGVLPMELLVGTLEEAARAQELPLRRGGERDVYGGGAGAPADIDERIGEMRAHRLGVRARPREQALPGRGRARHRNLQLGIVTSPRALVRLRPAVVEDIFAARMRFHVARHGAQE